MEFRTAERRFRPVDEAGLFPFLPVVILDYNIYNWYDICATVSKEENLNGINSRNRRFAERRKIYAI